MNENDSTSLFEYDNLRPDQQEIYNYVHNNPKNIVVIQGNPSSGKTTTLKAIAHSWKEPVKVIIFQHDLLKEFEEIAKCQSNTKLFMEVFDMKIRTLEAFEEQLKNFSTAEFLLTVVNLLAKFFQAGKNQFQGALLIFDEYTVIPKVLLIVILMQLKFYKIGAIFSGDKLQLINEKCNIMGGCTSYDIANDFADRSFSLKTNEKKSEYDEIVDYIRGFVSDEKIDDFANSLIAAIFTKHLLGSTQFTDTHVTCSHEELTGLSKKLMEQENHASRPYQIKTSSVKYRQGHTHNGPSCSKSDRFLKCLPLVKGSSYYVDQYSKSEKATLVSFDGDSVVLRFDDGKVITRHSDDLVGVVPYQHEKELLGKKGESIGNYSIYPANFKTALKSQGGKVSGPLDITFKQMSYRAMYVVFSRVKDISRIVRVSIEDPVGHLASCVIAFPEMVQPEFHMTTGLLKRRLFTKPLLNKRQIYKYYNGINLSGIKDMLQCFFDSNSQYERTNIREKLLLVAKHSTFRELSYSPVPGVDWKTTPIHELLKFKNEILRLLRMKENDRGIWISEFVARTPGMVSLTSNRKLKLATQHQLLYTTAKLHNLPEWGCNMMDLISNLPRNTIFIKELYNKYKNGSEREITTKWLLDILYGMTQKTIDPALPEECKKKSMDQDGEEPAEDEDEEDESDGEETDSSLESKNSMKGPTNEEKASSSMKRGNQEIEANGEIAAKKKKMNNPANI